MARWNFGDYITGLTSGDVVVDVAPLADRLGRGTPVPALRKVFVCSRCGGRDITVQRDAKYRGPLER